MPERRHELIIRLPNLSPTQANAIIVTFSPLVKRLKGSMSEIARDHYSDHQMHVSRRKVV